ncbi:3-oxo-5-alpha-steroid 4-dehydrogenase-domain-containing protein [Gamsiella multidivaricata]|uniref:3-oxo-5-alpha-steroid 4-dehydrogenase-domain-containing protein n=1 Tax=Gamsiella multidivaricata TaxID=101098 RepID=UPI00221ED4A0|nr:3-oxo-5-alpha-steroid 4-dehydrogenase-domain-containing protein [Gamsiella multidivaricata]KAI7832758.1 3-oxo-5-alpha-steroid 4-dehydrogenase-domain-containing protein [Gamsiella multidivaricata]
MPTMSTMSTMADWIPSLSQLIQLYFIIITSTALLAATLPPLRDSILTYGKLDAPSSSPCSSTDTTNISNSSATPRRDTNTDHGRFISVLKTLRVPKTWFGHFYVFATIWFVYLSIDLVQYTSARSWALPHILVSTYPYWSFLSLLNWLGIMPTGPSPQISSWTPPAAVLLAMSCYWIHVLRRWYESWFVERPSTGAQIHLGHYLVGISFYAAMAPALWVDAYESWVRVGSGPQWREYDLENTQAELKGLLESWRCVVGVGLFVWASWHQHRCHVILADLRKPVVVKTRGSSKAGGAEEAKGSQEYRVPFGDWFEYLVTPHYSAEMVIYFALYLTLSSSSSSLSPMTLLFAWVWVVVNLGIVAKETDQWYRSRFGEAYAGQRRAILIPFVY